MQAYELTFTPAHLPPLRIMDSIHAEALPHPHVSVGDPVTPGKGVRIPLTSRLVAAFNQDPPLIGRASAFRDPKTGKIVLGLEQNPDVDDARALVLLAASSRFPEGVTITPRKEVTLLARGEIPNGQQLLLIWPDGGKVVSKIPRARSDMSCSDPAISSTGSSWRKLAETPAHLPTALRLGRPSILKIGLGKGNCLAHFTARSKRQDVIRPAEGQDLHLGPAPPAFAGRVTD